MINVFRRAVQTGAVLGAATTLTFTTPALANGWRHHDTANNWDNQQSSQPAWMDNQDQNNPEQNGNTSTNADNNADCQAQQDRNNQKTAAAKARLQARLAHLNDVYAKVKDMGYSEATVTGYNQLKANADNAKAWAEYRVSRIHPTDFNCDTSRDPNYNQSIPKAKQALRDYRQAIGDLFSAILYS